MLISRAVLARISLALVLSLGLIPVAAPAIVSAASCVRISGGHFDAPGNDNYAAYLNGEYVRIHNYCTTTKAMGSWKVSDYGRIHTYTFSSTFKIGPGVTVTLYSGRGSNTATRRYWGRTYGAVWNNTPPERASLRTSAGTVVSSWSEY